LTTLSKKTTFLSSVDFYPFPPAKGVHKAQPLLARAVQKRWATRAPLTSMRYKCCTLALYILYLNLVVTVFCHLEGVDFRQFIFINICKLADTKIGGVKIVNIIMNFEG
jgi:hypothetical protein